MLYALFQNLQDMDLPGAGLMNYITFRAGTTLVLSLLIALVFGRKIIDRLQLMQVGEIVRDLGIEGQMQKKGTPTMGGVIIIISILVPCLLIGNLSNIYMMLMIVTTVWMGAIGFLDDWRKLKYRNKEGLKGKYKISGQVGLGLIVGITMWLSPTIVMRENIEVENTVNHEIEIVHKANDVKSPQTTIPFVKNNNFNYQWLTSWMDGEAAETAGWLVFIFVVVLVVTATSNGANLTDGLDGLAAGTSAIIGVALAIMAYLGGNIIYSSYLNIMYIPGSEELVVFAAAFIGALVGFLWYNAFPAQVFMGDTGSLTLGAILAVFAILIRKELLIPLLCMIFFVEDLSVILQVAYFKLTKRRYGEGKRIFKMTPLHHHFQKAGNAGIDALIQFPIRPVPESKIVTRFWIVGILLAVLTFVTLKIR
ncbi:MAG: phospho-N-acetylmuramoyl-pentapeptide-transferase [Muribaculaceae bacterium]|jgi:phospho-N-acetylmuramoyl-pentapeptide-transferase|nr:phospho-N-acetylmuramoyl-pentapeptide-transferase [Muribaculaceae bacterium]MBQ2371389.1 phospho-N-acetylmuramoyl-pentapeptide-transferase [Muribaculaceae bacterium]MBQ5722931.1 phospho-N-acetylmuramoyl-pentapeptide-transferase [Muribaculaceae bacterium]MBR5787595.1 phospho-N-acetylmuramoyl-pentapeptide-transferase [Muribaculaceae bacterium]